MTALLALVLAGTVASAPPGKVSPPAPAATAEARPEMIRALVMPAEVTGTLVTVVGTDQRRRLESDVASILQHFRRLTVLTSRDVKSLADLDANRQIAGCDTSCATEIAAALGARYVVGLLVEPTPEGVQLTVTLLDTTEAAIVGTGKARGARVVDLGNQLPFAVTDAGTVLKTPGDPDAAAILHAMRPKLAVLPIRGDAPRPPGLQVVVDEAAERLATRLGLVVLPGERYAAAATARGCAVDDLGCALPATASTLHVTQGVGVSLHRDAAAGTPHARLVRAALLGVDGGVVAHGEVAVADGEDVAAMGRAVAQVVEGLGTGTGRSAKPADRRRRLRDVDDRDDDRVLESFACTIMRGLEGVGATCELSRTALRITPHVFNLQSYKETIALDDVVGVEPHNPLGFPSGVRLLMRDGPAKEIVVGIGPRDRLLKKIDDLIH